VSQGNVTERRMAVDISEELARKGQEVREMTRDLDMLKVDVDVIDTMIRLRGAHGTAPPQEARRSRPKNRTGNDMTAFQGSCLCGEVAFEVEGP